MDANSAKGPLLVELREVSYNYPRHRQSLEVRALDKVSLSIAAGEFVALLGANASGKSTLAKQMNGLLVPEQGKAMICGLDSSIADNLPMIRQQIAMVFQNPDNQIVATVVEEDVAFGPENLGLTGSEIRQRVSEALQAVGMAEYRHHAPHLLSGGQKQRVAIAGAIAMQPKMLICDEATAMLDPMGRNEIMTCLRALHEAGMAIVFITHDPREAITADRVILMQEGRIVAEGTPREVLTRLELLQELGLQAPPMTELAVWLSEDGFLPRRDILSLDEMIEEIWNRYDPGRS